jgi:uncharacterized protein
MRTVTIQSTVSSVVLAAAIISVCAAANPDSDLLNAAKSANVGKLEQLLSGGANINAVDTLGKTPLFWSCSLGHSDVAKLLLDKKADANIKDRNGITPLMEAVGQGREELVRLLLENREVVHTDYRDLASVLAAARGVKAEVVQPLRGRLIEIDAVDKKGNSALMLAVVAGKPRIVELLLEKGAHATLRNNSGVTAESMAERKELSDIMKVFREFEKEKGVTRKMMAAVDSGNPDAVKALLGKGLSVNVQDRFGATPLIRAAAGGRTDVAKLLLERGALINDRDNKENTALILAAELGLKDMVVLLLNRGADPEMKNNAGLTALDTAKHKGRSEVMQILKEHDGLGKKLVTAVQAGSLEQVKALLDRGSAIDRADSESAPTIVTAVRGGNADLVQLLLERGANPSAKDTSGDTAMTVACGDCKLDMIKFLLTARANATAKNNLGYSPVKIAWDLKIDGKEACVAAFDYLKTYLSENDPGYKLILAAELGNTKLLRELIDNGANVDTENELEETALMVASREGRTDAVKLLLQKGADTEGGLTRAVDGGHVEIAKLLLNAGAEIQPDALCRSATAGKIELAELLLEKGANVNESFANDDQYEATPLALASAAGHADLVKLFLSKGADPSLKDSEGKTALDVASAANHQQVVDLLKSHEKK